MRCILGLSYAIKIVNRYLATKTRQFLVRLSVRAFLGAVFWDCIAIDCWFDMPKHQYPTPPHRHLGRIACHNVAQSA